MRGGRLVCVLRRIIVQLGLLKKALRNNPSASFINSAMAMAMIGKENMG